MGEIEMMKKPKGHFRHCFFNFLLYSCCVGEEALVPLCLSVYFTQRASGAKPCRERRVE